MVLAEYLSSTQISAFSADDLKATSKPMGQNFRDPLGTVLVQTVKHVPERAVHRDRPSCLVECAVVRQTQKKVEEAAARVVVGPLHDEPKPLRPLTAVVGIWFE